MDTVGCKLCVSYLGCGGFRGLRPRRPDARSYLFVATTLDLKSRKFPGSRAVLRSSHYYRALHYLAESQMIGECLDWKNFLVLASKLGLVLPLPALPAVLEAQPVELVPFLILKIAVLETQTVELAAYPILATDLR